MTAPNTVSSFSDEPGWGRALVASLPSSLRRVDGPGSEVAMVDGRGDWTGIALAQIERGCRQILLIDPEPAEEARMARLVDAVEASGAVCHVSERFASNPAIAAYRDWLGPDFGTITLESLDLAAPDAAVLIQLRLLRAVGISEVSLSHVSRTAPVCLVEADGVLAERRVHLRLSAVRSDAGPTRHLITAFAPAASARLNLTHGGDALPAEASLFTEKGVQILPSIHESAHRRDLRALLNGQHRNTADTLRALAEDFRLRAALDAAGRERGKR